MYSRIKFSLFLIIRSDYRLRSPNGNSHVLPLFNPSISSFSKQKRTTWGADLSLSGIIKIRRHQSDTAYSIALSGWHVWSKARLLNPQDEWNSVIQIGDFISSIGDFTIFPHGYIFVYQQVVATDQGSYFPLIQGLWHPVPPGKICTSLFAIMDVYLWASVCASKIPHAREDVCFRLLYPAYQQGFGWFVGKACCISKHLIWDMIFLGRPLQVLTTCK